MLDINAINIEVIKIIFIIIVELLFNFIIKVKI